MRSSLAFVAVFLQASQIFGQQLTLTGSNFPTSLSVDDSIPTDSSGLYITYTSTETLPTDGPGGGGDSSRSEGTRTSTSNQTDSVYTTTSGDYTVLVGSQTTAILTGTVSVSGNATATATASIPPQPTNTRPCNGYPEFCERSYSNITEVAAHNSPFVRPGNLASNQALDVVLQLNDGVRMRKLFDTFSVLRFWNNANFLFLKCPTAVQFQTHPLDGDIYLCHTSCDLLNVGKLEDYLRTVTDWLRAHPYDVITLVIGNGGFVGPTNFTAPIEKSGLIDFVYTPPKIPMSLEDWPVLSQMIFSGRRAVVFMDYKANQTEVPYLLDEFSQMSETPFSPTNRAFPCTVQRPPGLSHEDAKHRMLLANHNLNTEVNIAGASLLFPNTVLLNETNAVSGFGSAGRMGKQCLGECNCLLSSSSPSPYLGDLLLTRIVIRNLEPAS